MRTTLSLEPDVESLLARAREQGNFSFKDLVNEALRRGLKDMAAPMSRPKFVIVPQSLGKKVSNLDNIAELLAQAEGNEHR